MTLRDALFTILALLLVCGCTEDSSVVQDPANDTVASDDADALPADPDTALDADVHVDEVNDASMEEVDGADTVDPEDTTDLVDGVDALDGVDTVDPTDTMVDQMVDPVPESATFTIASWNANYNNTNARVVSHTKQVIQADIVGFQELGSLSSATKIIESLAAVDGGKACPECDYRAYLPTTGRAWPQAIIWRKSKFKLISKGKTKVHDTVDTNDCDGARNHHLGKSTVWVILEERTTGARFVVSNNHLVASVESNGRWKPCAGPVRKKLFNDHMDGIIETVKMANGKGLPIFVTGDFNVNYRADSRPENRIAPFPYKRFSNHNVYANWYFLGMENGAGTHGGGSRLIDYVHMTKAPRKLEPLSQKILAKGGSDHNPVRVRVRLFRQ